MAPGSLLRSERWWLQKVPPDPKKPQPLAHTGRFDVGKYSACHFNMVVVVVWLWFWLWLWLLLLLLLVGRNHQSTDLLQYRGECHLAEKNWPSCLKRTQVGGSGKVQVVSFLNVFFH